MSGIATAAAAAATVSRGRREIQQVQGGAGVRTGRP